LGNSSLSQYKAKDGIIGSWHIEDLSAFAAGGLITKPSQAHEIITKNKSDALYIGRNMEENPNWAVRAAKELNLTIS
jgi:2,4-dienoyl-CoA reductase-like NADH-dependent reductase (Old Yellow Enzyme family)